jgi:hypothetical protein
VTTRLPTRWSIRSGALFAALGVFSAGLLLAEVNVLSTRHFFRVDVSSGQRYTISETSRLVVQSLSRSTHIYVLLSSASPQLPEVRQLLQSYEAAGSLLSVTYIDPDRQPAETLALGQKLELGDEPTESQAETDGTGLLVESGDKRWFVRESQLSRVGEDGQHHFVVESELTEAIAQVQSSTVSRICFATGHGESSLDDAAPEGLIELRRLFTKSNVVAERVPVDVADPRQALKSCDAIAIVAPARPWPEDHEEALLSAWEDGASFALFLDPIVDERGRVLSWGLESLTQAFGIQANPRFVLERDPEMRLPSGLGETFFATPKAHSITRGLSTDSLRADARVLLTASSEIRPAPSGPALPLLTTSPSALAVDDLNDIDSTLKASSERRAIVVGAASDHLLPSGKRKRAMVSGSANLAENRSFRDPALFGNRHFTENAFSWILSRPPLVSVPERPPVRAGLNLSEASLSSLLRYVLVYMPAAAASLGGYVLVRRRRNEERSRAHGGNRK